MIYVVIPILVSFLLTLFLLPDWIRRSKKAGLCGPDIHKESKELVAESGGVIVIAGFALGVLLLVAINTFILDNTSNFVEIFALMTTVFIIAFIAFTDDISGWKIGLRRRTRLVLVAFSAIPLMAINAGRSEIALPILGSTELGIIYPLIAIPLGIVGAATTFNFLAGYNGLEAGQGVILLIAISTVSYLTGNSWLATICLIMVGSLLAFLIFNIYPAKIFPGDTLTYSVGGLIAIASILGNFERIAVFFFMPYIVETILKSRGGLVKQSFAKLGKGGELEMPYDKVYGLEHLSIYLMKKFSIKATEFKVVLSIWVTQALFVLLGFILFGRGLIQ